jgi:hypothetical protein
MHVEEEEQPKGAKVDASKQKTWSIGVSVSHL